MFEKHINWIDYGKTLGIFLVVFAHTDLFTPVKNGIYTFLMPVFFFISGYLFSYERNPSYKDFVKKRFRQLIIPYIWINIITYLVWFFIGRKVGADAANPVPWYEPIINALLGNGKLMVHDIPIWFLVCLFLVETIYYPVFRKVKRQWIGLACLIIFAYLNYTFSPFHLPFSANTAFVGIIFYTFGNMLHKTGWEVLKRPKWTLSLLSLGTVAFVTYENGRIAMYMNYYNNYFLFLLGGVAGIILIINLSHYLTFWFGKRKLIGYISKNTIIISGFHLLTFAFLKGVMIYLLQIPVSVLHEKIGVNIVFALISVLLCLPVIYVINNYLPFTVGRRKPKPTLL